MKSKASPTVISLYPGGNKDIASSSGTNGAGTKGQQAKGTKDHFAAGSSTDTNVNGFTTNCSTRAGDGTPSRHSRVLTYGPLTLMDSLTAAAQNGELWQLFASLGIDTRIRSRG